MARVVIHEAEMRQLLDSPSGPVVADLMRRGRAVQNRAKQLVRVDTSNLRASITVTPLLDGDEPVVQVGTNVEYGAYLEFGTRYMPAYPWLEPALSAAFE